MILTGLILAAGALAVGVAATFWDDLRSWLVDGLKILMQKIPGIVHGVKVFLGKIYQAYQQVSKTYYQDEQKKWHETVQTREISENEVPLDVLEKAQKTNGMYDVTNQFENILEMTH